jgi:hypothetical protein
VIFVATVPGWPDRIPFERDATPPEDLRCLRSGAGDDLSHRTGTVDVTMESTVGDEMSDYPNPDDVREEALLAAVRDLAAAVPRGDATRDELTAAFEAVFQVPIDIERMVNAIHVPADAGAYEGALRGLLERIPDGWGRWIRCEAGWYPLLVRLDAQLRQIDPDYEVYQVKEKLGTLRLYWSGYDIEAARAAVADAEAESARTSERCGDSGRLCTRREWLRTLCEG